MLLTYALPVLQERRETNRICLRILTFGRHGGHTPRPRLLTRLTCHPSSLLHQQARRRKSSYLSNSTPCLPGLLYSIAASSSTAVTKTEGTPELTSILANIPSAFVAKGVQTGSTSGLPPKPPTYKWRPQPGGDIPHAPDAYWPMIGYK